MSFKLFVFFLLVALTAIEARDFFKTLNSKHLSETLISRARNIESLVRKRRDAESSEEHVAKAAMRKFFMQAAWENDKEDVIVGFLNEVSDSDNNLTVIGWQRVLDEQGKVQEIRTIQLVIPPKPEDQPWNTVHEDHDDEDEVERFLPLSLIKETRELFEPMAALGIPTSITTETYDQDGELQALLYLDKDEMYGHAWNFSVYNKSSCATPEEVSHFISTLKPAGFGKPSVLKYDVDGNLIVAESNVKPYLWGSVMDPHGAPVKMQLEAPQIIAEISLQYPQSEIPKQLVARYNKEYPEYKWRVLVDPDTYYVTRDVCLTLTYDNFDLDETSDISYVVYGALKQ